MNFTIEFAFGIGSYDGWIQVDVSTLQNAFLKRMSCDFAILAGGQGKQCDGIVQLRLGAFPGSTIIVGSSSQIVSTSAGVTAGANLGCPLATTRVPFEGRFPIPTSTTLLFVFDLRTQPGFALTGELGSGRISYELDYGGSDAIGNNLEVLDPVAVEEYGSNLKYAKQYRR